MIIPVAVPPVSDVVTTTYTVVSLAKAPFSTLKVKLAPPAPSLAEYVVELNPMVTPDIVMAYGKAGNGSEMETGNGK